MANQTITITIPDTVLEQLHERAVRDHTTPGMTATALLTHACNRPTWGDIADTLDRNALAVELEKTVGERDRARNIAVLLEDENADLTAALAIARHQTIPTLQLELDSLRAADRARRGVVS